VPYSPGESQSIIFGLFEFKESWDDEASKEPLSPPFHLVLGETQLAGAPANTT